MKNATFRAILSRVFPAIRHYTVTACIAGRTVCITVDAPTLSAAERAAAAIVDDGQIMAIFEA